MYHIGLDDTDSTEGMCTTYLAYRLLKQLRAMNCSLEFPDYPRLIRHNPNIPWKTRGNASLAISLQTDLEKDELFSLCKKMLLKFSTSPHANSGLVLLQGRSIPGDVSEFSKESLHSVLGLKLTKRLLENSDATYLGLRSQQGLVGALAGIGNRLERDHTYELIAYRKHASKRRQIDNRKVIEMSRVTFPQTFNNYDEKSRRVLIMPHGPDPVLLGIRGESPQVLIRAIEMLKPIEDLLGWLIFKSNQGTGEHLENNLDLSNLKAYTSGKIVAKVSTTPRIERGGHVFYKVTNEQGSIDCACYEPSGDFRKNALKLITGDKVEVAGGVRKSTSLHPRILNTEYFMVKRLATKYVLKNPACSNCGVRLVSEGRNQGYQCRKCKKRFSRLRKEKKLLARELAEGVVYIPPPGSQRHLTRPLQRYGVENTGSKARLVGDWIF